MERFVGITEFFNYSSELILILWKNLFRGSRDFFEINAFLWSLVLHHVKALVSKKSLEGIITESKKFRKSNGRHFKLNRMIHFYFLFQSCNFDLYHVQFILEVIDQS